MDKIRADIGGKMCMRVQKLSSRDKQIYFGMIIGTIIGNMVYFLCK